MRRIDWKVFVLLGIIVSVGVGFLYGTGVLGGDTKDPGSKEDPLVTKSYADGSIEQKVQAMDTRISSLEAKIQSLENQLSLINGGGATVGTGTTGTGTTGTGTGSGTGSGSTGSGTGTGSTGAGTGSTGSGTGAGSSGTAVSQANIGKTGAVTADVVNLRESASTSSTIKKKLSPSDSFTITKVDKDWYQVQLSDGTVGWVAGYLVKVK